MPQFGEMLRELREERRLTQIELANAMHISSSSISAYEIGSSADGACTGVCRLL